MIQGYSWTSIAVIYKAVLESNKNKSKTKKISQRIWTGNFQKCRQKGQYKKILDFISNSMHI